MLELLELMRALRDPVRGCPWDQKQTFKTIAPYTIEEAYEVADAIERDAIAELKGELGDLLFQVVFHAQMADELGEFDFDDVASGIVEKMRQRHPHVFGDTHYGSAAELNQAWEATKASERAALADGPVSVLDGVALNLPALTRAEKIQKRAARVGFDWTDIDDVWAKTHEEIAELRQAAGIDDEAKRSDALEDELGDLLFTVVNLARHYKLDPEKSLRRASLKFESRFRQLEQLATEQQQVLESMELAELDALWDRAKTLT